MKKTLKKRDFFAILNFKPFIYRVDVIRKLEEVRQAKKEHKNSDQCEWQNPGGCTACHFWSGAISALSEILGEPGVID